MDNNKLKNETPDQTPQTFSESIECGDFVLRPFNEKDEESVVRILNNEKVREKLGTPYPYTIESFKSFFDKIKNDNETTYFAIEKDGEFIGSIALDLEDNSTAMFGYWLDEEYWGKGIITKAIEEVIKYATKKFSVKKFYAKIFDNNVGSRKVLENNGFIFDSSSDSFIKMVE